MLQNERGAFGYQMRRKTHHVLNTTQWSLNICLSSGELRIDGLTCGLTGMPSEISERETGNIQCVMRV